jgi:hypothetical protein
LSAESYNVRAKHIDVSHLKGLLDGRNHWQKLSVTEASLFERAYVIEDFSRLSDSEWHNLSVWFVMWYAMFFQAFLSVYDKTDLLIWQTVLQVHWQMSGDTKKVQGSGYFNRVSTVLLVLYVAEYKENSSGKHMKNDRFCE